jgi:hypothetical protein
MFHPFAFETMLSEKTTGQFEAALVACGMDVAIVALERGNRV